MTFNPLTPAFRRDPYPTYARLREEVPVGQVEEFGIHYLCRYDDVLSAFKQPLLFSSGGMRDMMSGGTGMMGTGDRSNAEEMRAENLVACDPPIHDRLRNIVNRGFTPRQISALEPRVREIAEELGIELPAPRYLFSFPNDYLYRGVLYRTTDALFEVVCEQRPDASARDDVAALRWIALANVELADIAFASIRRAVVNLRGTPAAPGVVSE